MTSSLSPRWGQAQGDVALERLERLALGGALPHLAHLDDDPLRSLGPAVDGDSAAAVLPDASTPALPRRRHPVVGGGVGGEDEDATEAEDHEDPRQGAQEPAEDVRVLDVLDEQVAGGEGEALADR